MTRKPPKPQRPDLRHKFRDEAAADAEWLARNNITPPAPPPEPDTDENGDED